VGFNQDAETPNSQRFSGPAAVNPKSGPSMIDNSGATRPTFAGNGSVRGKACRKLSAILAVGRFASSKLGVSKELPFY